MNRRARNLDLGVIGNSEVAALVDADASIIWYCLPRLDGDPVFCALLDSDRDVDAQGLFSVDLVDRAEVSQRYLRNTAILETTMSDAHGNGLRIVDFCPRFRARGRIFRAAMVVRLIEPIAGRPVIRIRVRPRFDHGAFAPQVSRGSHHIAYRGGEQGLRITTNGSLSAIANESPCIVDGPLALILAPDQTIEESPLALANSFLEQTRDYWDDWVRSLAVPFEWQEAVIRAAISLKLCTFDDTGAVVAALTTSIPESAGSGRNWDYRYCWLRDAYFVIQALNRLGATRTMEGYLRFIDRIVASCADDDIAPLYSINGRREVPERTVASLRGYRGMGPVRVGNHAWLQRQHDVYGAIVLASAHSFFDERLTNLGDAVQFKQLECLGQRALAVHDRPDAGPWEFRGFERVHTFSAAMCWAGADRLARIASRLGLEARAAHWSERARDLREHVLAGAWHTGAQAFTSSYGNADLDATALLLPELGLVDAADPRFTATLAAIERDLKAGDWLYRYRHHDDFGRPETAFTICAFWYVNALALAGRRDEARDHFERLLARRTRLGLLSEDIDPVSGEWWGNFPQTYSLVGIINCAVRLSRSWEEAL
ncbi:MAG: glycoside hydrolase family 15 protein [Steroidobacteraceae bacterium]|nr:glycoside hydrolase family 15 protein [Steroidobacteraceae bacterium]